MKRAFAGIDVGSSAVKAVLIDAQGEMQGSATAPTGIEFAQSANDTFQSALARSGILERDVAAVVSCGYGRRNVAFASGVRTEIACLAKGVHSHFRDKITVLDIGGRDIKVVHVDAQGTPENFKMNAQCAASTGAFLEDIAGRMRLPIESLNALAESADSPATISAHCAVFAAGEVLSAARSGVPIQNIVLGIYHAMVKHIAEMITAEVKIVITGGVAAHHPTIVKLTAETLGRPVSTLPQPQLIGALGAALFARDSAQAEQEILR